MVAEAERAPEVPLMVMVDVPVVAVPLAVKVRVNALLPAAEFGLRVAVTPLGKPDAVRLTFPISSF
jgi:hypothetical protein